MAKFFSTITFLPKKAGKLFNATVGFTSDDGDTVLCVKKDQFNYEKDAIAFTEPSQWNMKESDVPSKNRERQDELDHKFEVVKVVPVVPESAKVVLTQSQIDDAQKTLNASKQL